MQSYVDAIARHRVEILERWARGARNATFAEGLNAGELAGAIPEYLASLGQVEPRSQQAAIERHLSQRLRQGANLNDILTDFASLIRCASRFLDDDALSDELRRAIAEAARIFNEHMLEDEQEEKAYVRRLRRIVADVDFADPPALRARLGEALGVIMEALRADTAALQLVDAPSGALRTIATAGRAGDELERYVGALDTPATGAEMMDLDVSEALRAKDIHALLGVRLSWRGLLRGVMYMGLRERRPFNASEVRRLDDLGDVMAVHLEHARPVMALHDEARGRA
jgi:hypothetical protein